ncbi:tryptophan synthase subunit alpha [Desertibacillus haloalkaliphilus]|uniref:tryptophan synthase subunit alpha n=1 Tax=Desertibacillus haloalkaliphilus TaxID=1328930 RepID=UPI001C26EBD8|nr:tryptophan synthase subunit alpha [Desertibacillus haloalkaliphilus]MBU8907254.1 tryptophan synthase subunit alpha [Desertibacillus haloalkaliphilus]
MSNVRFKEQVENKKDLFIPFITAGDPHPDVTIDLALALQEGGADVLELGIPYSDPLADGPVIQRSAKRALQHGMTIEKAIALVSRMRERGLTIPLVIFTYYNPLLQLGIERFFELAHEHQIDGLLVPDLPYEESQELAKQCREQEVAYISLVAPTSNQRIAMIAKEAQGFLYCVSSLGVTGVRDTFDPRVYDFLSLVKENSPVPVAVGFGISKRDQVEALANHCDGVIVGSAIIKMVEQLESQLIDEKFRDEALSEIKRFVVSLISS